MATGTGKTSTALEIARQLLLQNKIDKVVVVPPNNNALCNQWYNEILEWEEKYLGGDYLDVYQDYGSNRERQRFVDSSSNSIIVASRSYEKLEFILKSVSKIKLWLFKMKFITLVLSACKDWRACKKILNTP